jgi:hypothetical protein
MNLLRPLVLLSFWMFYSGCVKKNRIVDSKHFELAPVDHWMHLSEVADSIFYIPLITDGKVLMSNRLEIRLETQHLLVKDNKTQHVLLFDRKGKFLRQIGSLGKSPHEYLSCYAFDIDESANRIFIYDRTQSLLIIYDLAGQMIQRATLDFYGGGMRKMPNKKLFFFLTPNKNLPAEVPNLIITDYQGNVEIKKFFPQAYPSAAYNSATIYTLAGQTIVVPGSYVGDTVYRLTKENDLVPHISFSFEGMPDPKDSKFDQEAYETIQKNSGYQFSNPPIESEKYLFKMGAYNRAMVCIMLDKTNGKSYNLRYSVENSRYFGLINDLDGGPFFFPSGQLDDHHLYKVVSPSTLKQNIQLEYKESFDSVILYPAWHTNLIQIADSMHEEYEDPIICIVRFKNSKN